VVPEDDQMAPAVEEGTPTAAEVAPQEEPPEEEDDTEEVPGEGAASLLEEIVALGT